MTEMQQALKMMGKLPSNEVVKNPAGTYSFAGKVNAKLAYFRRDGQPLTDEDIYAIHNFGAGLLKRTIGVRTFATEEDALNALREQAISQEP